MRLLSFAVLAVLVIALPTLADPPKAAEEIDVQVLAILVSANHKNINPKLVDFAKHVQKKDASLTGFRLERTSKDSMELGEMKKFDLVGKEVVEVTVNRERNDKGRITLTIKPPMLDQITYECACDKFFSVATQHYVTVGKDRQQLFIAIMAKPCGAKK